MRGIVFDTVIDVAYASLETILKSNTPSLFVYLLVVGISRCKLDLNDANTEISIVGKKR